MQQAGRPRNCSSILQRHKFSSILESTQNCSGAQTASFLQVARCRFSDDILIREFLNDRIICHWNYTVYLLDVLLVVESASFPTKYRGRVKPRTQELHPVRFWELLYRRWGTIWQGNRNFRSGTYHIGTLLQIQYVVFLRMNQEICSQLLHSRKNVCRWV